MATEGRSRGQDEKYCGLCGQLLHVSASACTSCGALQADGTTAPVATPVTQPPVQPVPTATVQPQRSILGADEAYCPSCGSVIKKLTEVCPSCGVRQRQSGTHTSHAVTSDKNKWVALILAVALGSFGAHKFYLGKYAQGFIYLALFWTFIPMFVAFVEALIYLFTPEDSFSSRYAQRRWLSG